MTSGYAPRSGALRKVRNPLPIYREEEIPEGTRDSVMKIAGTLKNDAKFCQKYENEKPLWIKQPSQRRSKKTTKGIVIHEGTQNRGVCNGRVHLSSNHDENVNQVSTLSESEYNALYPSMPSDVPEFPVTSYCTDMSLSQRSDGSDYDMDSEDEEWLKSHSEYSNITPSRFEYIFAVLNKRNTHVTSKAISALRQPYHTDFYRIFPYWIEKRLRDSTKICSKLDPYLIFVCNAAKTTPPRRKCLQQAQQRVYEKSSNSAEFIETSTLKLKKHLKYLKGLLLPIIENAENDREMLLQRFGSLALEKRREESKSSLFKL